MCTHVYNLWFASEWASERARLNRILVENNFKAIIKRYMYTLFVRVWVRLKIKSQFRKCASSNKTRSTYFRTRESFYDLIFYFNAHTHSTCIQFYSSCCYCADSPSSIRYCWLEWCHVIDERERERASASRVSLFKFHVITRFIHSFS